MLGYYLVLSSHVEEIHCELLGRKISSGKFFRAQITYTAVFVRFQGFYASFIKKLLKQNYFFSS